MNTQVFISYSSNNKNYVSLVKTFLESSGITSIWHDEDKLLAGVDLREHIMRGVRESACCIFLLDEHSSNSLWCMAEIGGFLGANKPVIVHPVKEKDSRAIPPLLAGIKTANTPEEIVKAVKAMPEQSPLSFGVTTDLHVERFVGDINAAIKSKIMKYVREVAEAETAIARNVNENKVLIGTEAIEKAAIRMIHLSNREFFTGTREDSPSEDYINLMAERLAKAKNENGELEYHLDMPAKTRSINERVKRSEIFKAPKPPWPFEVLIVGDSMIIALAGRRGEPIYEAAIQVTDPEFVRKASKWFNEVAWGADDEGPLAEDSDKPTTL